VLLALRAWHVSCSGTGVPSLHFLVIVRSGREEIFRDLSDTFRGFPATVIWDRRRRERRVAGQSVPIERRQGQRRADPPRDTWRTLGFIIIESDSPPAEASARRNA
jgi:hypothetical protein